MVFFVTTTIFKKSYGLSKSEERPEGRVLGHGMDGLKNKTVSETETDQK